MVTEAVLRVLGAVFTFLLELLPDVERPAWLDSAVTALADALAFVPQLGNWFPLPAIGHSILFISACTVAAFAIRITRIVASFFTGGGGSAA